MPVSLEFLRGVLGVLCVFFAHMAGRSAAAVRQGRQRVSRLYGWVLRTALCGAILVFRHEIDSVAVGVWTVAAIAFGAGMWDVLRQRPSEDLSHEIFPE